MKRPCRHCLMLVQPPAIRCVSCAETHRIQMARIRMKALRQRSKLTDSQRAQICNLARSDRQHWTTVRIARALMVSQKAVSRVLTENGLNVGRGGYRKPKPIVKPDPGPPQWPTRCDACDSAVYLIPDRLGRLYAECRCRRVA